MSGFKRTAVDESQPELALRPAAAGPAQVGGEVALERPLGKRARMAEQAEALLPVGDNGAAAGRVARRAGRAMPGCVSSHDGKGRRASACPEAAPPAQSQRPREAQPNTSAVIVWNQDFA